MYFSGSGNECKDGAIRLVDGNIEQEGRPEVCVNGIWGSICHNGWTSNDAYATCLTLGYKGKSSMILKIKYQKLTHENNYGIVNHVNYLI